MSSVQTWQSQIAFNFMKISAQVTNNFSKISAKQKII
jgi:hypothetical protein